MGALNFCSGEHFLTDFAFASCPQAFLYSYRVGSENFSRRKIGHAHDNSADSEHVASVREPNVHAHFIFRFENGQGNQFFSIRDQNTAETSQPQAQPVDDLRAIARALPRGLQRPREKSLVKHGFVEKKANFVASSKLLLTLSKPGFFWAPKTKGGGGTLCPLAKTLLPFSESIQVNFF